MVASSPCFLLLQVPQSILGWSEAQPQVWFGEAAPPGMMPPPQAALQLITPRDHPVPMTAHPDKHHIPGRIYCPTHNTRLCL